MIPSNANTLDVTSNLTGRKIAMSVDQASMGYIMRSLTNLYSDPELASIREYSTNARDSHIEAGVEKPILVTLPSPLAPFLRVQDFGVGLSPDDIHEIYSRYGASTKRETNDQNGMLGFGCKAALAYAAQFTLTAVKDGVRTEVVVSRDEKGGGSMTVVDTSATDDHNGVTVEIPVKAQNLITQKATAFFAHWEPGTVLVNGEEPTPVEGLRVTDSITLVKGFQSLVVMGNVAYPASISNYDLAINHGHAIVARVPIGTVEFTPSREALEYSDSTKAAIETIVADFKEGLGKAIQAQIDDAPDRRAAMKIMLDWRRSSNLATSQTYRWRGREIPTSLSLAGPAGRMVIVPASDKVLSRHSSYHSVATEGLGRTVFFYNYDRPSFTAGQKKKILKWAETGLEKVEGVVDNYVLVKDKPPTDWIEPSRIFDFAPVLAIKLPRNAPNPSGRIPGSYDMYVGREKQLGVPADEIDTSHPLLYTSNRYINPETREVLTAEYGDDFTVVCLTENRVAKFKRNFPGAVYLYARIRELHTAWVATITEDQRKALELQDTGLAASLDAVPAGVEDPLLLEAIKFNKIDLSALKQTRQLFGRVGIHTANNVTSDGVSPLSRYPFWDRSVAVKRPEMALHYLNTTYNEFLKDA